MAVGSQPQVPIITVNPTAQALYGAPTRSEAFNNITQQQSLGIYNAAAVANANSTFSSTQPTDQAVSTPAANTSVKTAQTGGDKTSVFNVVADYDWTLSRNKKAEESTIPYITLREFDIVSSNVATALYASVGVLPALLAANKDAASQSSMLQGMKSLIDKVPGAASAEAVATAASAGISDLVSKVQTQLTPGVYGPEWSEDLKNTYGGLYLREPTNITYKLPYFNRELARIGASFEDSANPVSETGGLLGDAANKISMAVTAGATLPSLVQPGVYIQRPKYFQFGRNEATINFNFTLFNTLTIDAYKANSKLIKRLLIKNLPQRMSKVVVYPPAIYEVTVPGRAFYPYCYIDNLTVTHEGTKRIISMEDKDEIVPDAYVISISLKSLTTDTNNFYVEQMGNAGVDMGTRKLAGAFDGGGGGSNDGGSGGNSGGKAQELPADANSVKTVQQVQNAANQTKNYQAAAFTGMGGR